MTPRSLICHDALQELARAARDAPKGDIVEVGVYQGGSARVLAEVAIEQGRTLFLFDTFWGIPMRDDERDTHAIGDFSETSADAVREAIPSAVVIPGIFPYTLTAEPSRIAFAHVDVDQYESTRLACEALAARMVEGSLMVFDDYDVLPGAKAAVDEVFPGRVGMSAQGKARVRF